MKIFTIILNIKRNFIIVTILFITLKIMNAQLFVTSIYQIQENILMIVKMISFINITNLILVIKNILIKKNYTYSASENKYLYKYC